MIRKHLAKISLFLLAGFFTSFTGVNAEEAAIYPFPNPQAIYILSEHVSEAEASVYVESKESRKGIWEDDHFSFYGLDKEGNIQVISESQDGQNYQSIQMNALQGTRRFLQFQNVPTGNGILFYYNTKLTLPTKQNVYIYVALNAGKKQIARFRVTCNQEGWQKIWLPLGILRLFSRTFPLTIQIISDKKLESAFKFYAEVF